MKDLQQKMRRTAWLRDFLSHARNCFGLNEPSLIELPGKVLNESDELCSLHLLESSQCDADVIRAQIMMECYGKPFLIQTGAMRQLHFSLGMIQSAMRIDDPFALEVAYTRKMMAFLLFAPTPEHILMVGLGGGSLAKFCYRHLPSTRLSVIEINPDVIALRDTFHIPDNARLTIIQADAADYLPLHEGDTDVLLLDGFDATGVAPTFLKRDFYQAALRRLRPAGLLVANFAGPKAGWAPHFSLLNEVFDGRVQLKHVAGSDNYIAFAFTDDHYPPKWAELKPQAKSLANQIPLDFPVLLKRLRKSFALQATRSQSQPHAHPNF